MRIVVYLVCFLILAYASVNLLSFWKGIRARRLIQMLREQERTFIVIGRKTRSVPLSNTGEIVKHGLRALIGFTLVGLYPFYIGPMLV